MTREEYIKEFDAIDKARNTALRELKIKYALSNSPFAIGDTITDGTIKIVIDKIGVYDFGNFSTCLYFGCKLTKANKKGKTIDSICQSRAKRVEI